MSECVVRMEMPKNNCEMAVEIKGVGDWCPIAARVCDYYSTKKMPDWCPIICPLLEGHGRLIDAEARVDEYIINSDGDVVSNIRHTVEGILGDYAELIPTVVPAERREI